MLRTLQEFLKLGDYLIKLIKFRDNLIQMRSKSRTSEDGNKSRLFILTS